MLRQRLVRRLFIVRSHLLLRLLRITLIPLFFIVGAWGGPKRETAARKLLFYTLAGGLIMLVGLVGLAASVHKRTGEPLTFGIPELAAQMQQQMQIAESNAPQPAGAPSPIEVKQYWYDVQWWVFLAIFVGFAIKTPLIPFHTWLPIAYAEAPTPGTLMMAGVLSKLGCYGFLRICVPLLPYACWNIGVPLVAGTGGGRDPLRRSCARSCRPISSGSSPTAASATSASSCSECSHSTLKVSPAAPCRCSTTD